jgi:hypothetical protein
LVTHKDIAPWDQPAQYFTSAGDLHPILSPLNRYLTGARPDLLMLYPAGWVNSPGQPIDCFPYWVENHFDLITLTVPAVALEDLTRHDGDKSIRHAISYLQAHRWDDRE